MSIVQAKRIQEIAERKELDKINARMRDRDMKHGYDRSPIEVASWIPLVGDQRQQLWDYYYRHDTLLPEEDELWYYEPPHLSAKAPDDWLSVLNREFRVFKGMKQDGHIRGELFNVEAVRQNYYHYTDRKEFGLY